MVKLVKRNHLTHGMCGTRFYRIWTNVRSRCNNKNSTGYKYWGGRGIKCFWKNFEEFKEDMYEGYQEHIEVFGEKNTSIDRIDNNGNYCKKNCQWSTPKEQNRNMRDNRLISFNGNTLCLADWAKKLKINRHTISERLKVGWSIEEALTKPKFINRLLTYRGKTMCVKNWSKKLNIREQAIYYRLSKKWSVDRTLSTKVTKGANQFTYKLNK